MIDLEPRTTLSAYEVISESSLFGLAGFFAVLMVLGTACVGPQGPNDPMAILILFGAVGFLVTFLWSILRYLRLIHNVRDAL